MNALCYRRLIEDKGKVDATRVIEKNVQDEAQVDSFIHRYVLKLLDAGDYTGAGIVLFGDTCFNPRPISVQRIWRAIEDHALVLLQGAAGVGKTLTPICWLLLDWLYDPQFTNVKLISATKGHASSNAYSDLVRMHRDAIIKLPGEPTSDYIGLDNKERKSGISIVAIPEGSDGKGRLQGFHPHPRPKPHHKLGNSSRVRIYMDECEKIPGGVWQGISNVKKSMSGKDVIKVIGSYNPHDPASITAKNATPPNGWDSFDVETGVAGKDEWMSKEGWFVCRIDGKKNENVIEKKLIFPGMITWEGYRNGELAEGGNSVDHYVFDRGAYPPEGAVGVIISQRVFTDAKGEFMFVGPTVKVGGVDIAVDGRDRCVMSAGRTGDASGFKPIEGPLIRFEEPRKVLQLDQQFEIKKGDTKIVGDGIMEAAIRLGISPEYLCVDATGNGSAVFSYLKAIWSNQVQGIDFNASATNIKILMEDQYLPEDLYDGIVSEVLFALAKWMEFRFLAISPGVRLNPLEMECTTRKYVIGLGKKLKAEKKDDYKLRMSAKSPDFLDSLSCLLHAARARAKVMGRMTDKPPPEKPKKKPIHGIVDRSPRWLVETGV